MSLALSVALAATVETGLDVVAGGDDAALRSRRLGVLCHAASVTADGRQAVDLLRSRGLDVRRIFAPEHGWRGEAAAGEAVADGVDSKSGVPVVSLYGGRAAPRKADLEGLDLLVVDLQDAGVRFYTYAATMLLALEAAAEAGLPVVVLDRPNPLGGERLEGPTCDPEFVATRSLFALAPGPLVHGLTLGEMAQLAHARRLHEARRGAGFTPAQRRGGDAGVRRSTSPLEKPRLTVIAMRGWRRSMTWADTGRAWPTPSPNLRSAEAALAYPGTALLEGTNVSEGRGTTTPFLLLGTPWADGVALAREVQVAGFGLEATEFTPQASPSAPEPKHEGVACRGLRVRVLDPKAATTYALGLSLLAAFKRQPGFAWRDKGEALDRLLGTRRVREALEAGRSVPEIVAADQASIEAFRRERADALLYE